MRGLAVDSTSAINDCDAQLTTARELLVVVARPTKNLLSACIESACKQCMHYLCCKCSSQVDGFCRTYVVRMANTCSLSTLTQMLVMFPHPLMASPV